MRSGNEHLPLSEPSRGSNPRTSDPRTSEARTSEAGISETDIRRLVVGFYTAARTDDVIGPVFEGSVDDWDTHFDRMCDFWSSAILKTGRYSGRPAMQHFGLGLTPEHFERWLCAWERTARDELGAAKAAPFIDMGQRMARSMMNMRGVLS